jgi:murein DD-endopeptidase MepM/ murein hydrolase activator NlpD
VRRNLKAISRKITLAILLIILVGLILPQELSMPVEGATKNSYNPKSFWYYPWGKSGTHKGVDIFAKTGTNVNSSVSGLVLFTGRIGMGGMVVLILGPKWRLHYYAHLNEIKTSTFSWVGRGKIIGTVGTSGNARGKQPHLHYSIMTPIPYPWHMDTDHQGWKKIFYVNPIGLLESTE